MGNVAHMGKPVKPKEAATESAREQQKETPTVPEALVSRSVKTRLAPIRYPEKNGSAEAKSP